MDRRNFVKMLPLGAVAVTSMPTEAVGGGKPDGIRISSEKGDPGERLFAELCGDGRRPRVFLDGVRQEAAVMADERLGVVRRAVITERGNVAVNHVTGEIYYEDVRGSVVVEIVG